MTLSFVQSMLLGAGDISQDSLTTWVVGAVMAGVMAVLGFLVRNVFPRSEAVDPAQCESCECSITAGDDPEVDL